MNRIPTTVNIEFGCNNGDTKTFGSFPDLRAKSAAKSHESARKVEIMLQSVRKFDKIDIQILINRIQGILKSFLKFYQNR